MQLTCHRNCGLCVTFWDGVSMWLERAIILSGAFSGLCVMGTLASLSMDCGRIAKVAMMMAFSSGAACIVLMAVALLP